MFILLKLCYPHMICLFVMNQLNMIPYTVTNVIIFLFLDHTGAVCFVGSAGDSSVRGPTAARPPVSV